MTFMRNVIMKEKAIIGGKKVFIYVKITNTLFITVPFIKKKKKNYNNIKHHEQFRKLNISVEEINNIEL